MGLILRPFPDSDARQGAGIIASGGVLNGETDLDLFVSSGSTSSLSYSAVTVKGNTGNVSIGDATATAMFNVGTANQFQVSSTGVASMAAGSTVNSTAICLADGTGCGINGAATQTTVSCSTSGSVVFSEPLTGTSYKLLMLYSNGCVGTASYTYPVAFTNTPTIAVGGGGLVLTTSLTTSAITVTGTDGNGNATLVGY